MTDLDILSAGAAQSLARQVAAGCNVRLAGSFGAVGSMREKLLSGEPCDVIILTRPMVDDLINEGHALSGTSADLGNVATSIAVMPGQNGGLPRTPDELRAFLVGASLIFIPDPVNSTAGRHVMDVLRRLGIAQAVEGRLRVFANGATAMAALAVEGNGNAIGCTQATEILATPGVALAGPLPKGCDLSTVYSAVVAAAAKHPDAARQFIAQLTGPAASQLRAAAGFE